MCRAFGNQELKGTDRNRRYRKELARKVQGLVLGSGTPRDGFVSSDNLDFESLRAFCVPQVPKSGQDGSSCKDVFVGSTNPCMDMYSDFPYNS